MASVLNAWNGCARRRAVRLVLTIGLALLPIFAPGIGEAQNFQVLYNFQGGSDGAWPYASLIADADGNLYGTTSYGGSLTACGGGGCGTVFKVDPLGNETVLYSFAGGSDGAHPEASLIRDAAGNLYGTTYAGGSSEGAGWGTIFKVDSAGHETVLYSFSGGMDGANPLGGLIVDMAGNLYGTTAFGGNPVSSGLSLGVVFKLDRMGNETVLHRFNWADGAGPQGNLIRDSASNLYGTAASGGAYGYGVVFKLDPAANETVLYSFPGGEGALPEAGVIADSAGNLYGTTYQGGAGSGIVFELDPNGNETVLHTFTRNDGQYPHCGLVRDAAGDLYGTTTAGGSGSQGVVFGLSASGHEKLLYQFSGAGGTPYAGLLASGGALYGTAYSGGSGSCVNGCGQVFEVILP